MAAVVVASEAADQVVEVAEPSLLEPSPPPQPLPRPRASPVQAAESEPSPPLQPLPQPQASPLQASLVEPWFPRQPLPQPLASRQSSPLQVSRRSLSDANAELLARTPTVRRVKLSDWEAGSPPQPQREMMAPQAAMMPPVVQHAQAQPITCGGAGASAASPSLLQLRLPAATPKVQAASLSIASTAATAMPAQGPVEAKPLSAVSAMASPWQVIGSRAPSAYTPYCYEEFEGPFTNILAFLTANKLVEGLPLDERGVLRVSMPFCASFIECALLAEWLKSTFLVRQGIRGVHVLGTELITDPSYQWDLKEKWVKETFPGMELELRQADLAEEAMPPAALTIGIHPEASRGPPWDRIVANLLRAGHGGVCVFATFFDVEAQAVTEFCLQQGVQTQVFENAYYNGRQIPSSPWMRFIVVARPGRAGVPLPGHPAASPLFGPDSDLPPAKIRRALHGTLPLSFVMGTEAPTAAAASIPAYQVASRPQVASAVISSSRAPLQAAPNSRHQAQSESPFAAPAAVGQPLLQTAQPSYVTPPVAQAVVPVHQAVVSPVQPCSSGCTQVHSPYPGGTVSLPTSHPSSTIQHMQPQQQQRHQRIQQQQQQLQQPQQHALLQQVPQQTNCSNVMQGRPRFAA